MKKYIILFAATLTLLFSACQEKELLTPSNDGMVTLKAGFQDDEPDTKTYLGPKAGNTTPVLWSAGDKIKVNGTEYTLASGEGTAYGEFNITAAEQYRAVYPETLTTTDWTSGTSIAVTLPATQPFTRVSSNSTIANGVLPMVGYSTTEHLVFRNICGVLIFDIEQSGIDKVTSLTITCDAQHNISGAGTVTITNSKYPTLAMTTTAEEPEHNVVTITIPSEGVTISGKESFYVVLPTGTYESLTLAIGTESHGTVTKEYGDITVYAGETRKSEIVTIPTYDQYLGDWRIYSLSSTSTAAYVNITISTKVENESYTITTEALEYAGNTNITPVPSYPFVFTANFDPATGKITIAPQKVATVKYSESGSDEGVDMDMFAMGSNGSSSTTNAAATIVGTWYGSKANPTIGFEGSDYAFGGSGTQKVDRFYFHVYSGSTKKTTTAPFKLMATSSGPIRIVKRAAVPAFTDYVGEWKLYGMSSSGYYYDATISVKDEESKTLKMTIPNFGYKGGTETTYNYDLEFELKYMSDGSVRIPSQSIVTGLTVIVDNTSRSDNGTTVTDGIFRAVAYVRNVSTNAGGYYVGASNSVSLAGKMVGSGAGAQVFFEGTTYSTSSATNKVESLRFFPMASNSTFANASFSAERLRTYGGSLGMVKDLPMRLVK